ncbi:hypothetical protein EJ06DRAFT_327700 [Trichodelitschia bisporula]|uniref:Uncharacterized protein n=1 Tax=Trichodelitschia bisporula TaxID=703511 RepID=A0A6G1I262_9PEZI|nr:hypothetical protein EJ06DRAFT_327700 [Trichodelitschia bisporula]
MAPVLRSLIACDDFSDPHFLCSHQGPMTIRIEIQSCSNQDVRLSLVQYANLQRHHKQYALTGDNMRRARRQTSEIGLTFPLETPTHCTVYSYFEIIRGILVCMHCGSRYRIRGAVTEAGL